MSIAILPARLANQIAAGEVVERPASVIKELVENSLDAGATSIHIDVDKGGIKKIKITDNGKGIVKDELTLALSRHATSKIKDLNDLESINSLGFRGEALASISSVSRLTLTSKPVEQATAWQAIAEGRDMSVDIQPAAHPDGTTIEVLDLFFNTPARRKFLRTEKTEFNHIDEVVKRIALAHFEVSFVLTHNGSPVRQYRMASTQAQRTKRVAMVCGPKFIEHAVEVDCPHDSMRLSGWLAKPSFSRNQNDLCYSYVNGRMMRDKLINHAIRQAYADLLPADTYPAFVLFLELDFREVDVNVHPAKHEVRFHQSRYVHDFIYSVCHKALLTSMGGEELLPTPDEELALVTEQSYVNSQNDLQSSHAGSSSGVNTPSAHYQQLERQDTSYITPLQQNSGHQGSGSSNSNYQNTGYSANHSTQKISPTAVHNYQSLMTPHDDVTRQEEKSALSFTNIVNPLAKESQKNTDQNDVIPVNQSAFLSVLESGYALLKVESDIRVLSLFSLAKHTYGKYVAGCWQQQNEIVESHSEGLVSQPLLLPVLLNLSEQQITMAVTEQSFLSKAGIVFVEQGKGKLQIRQFPAVLREQNVSSAFEKIIDELLDIQANNNTDHEQQTFSFADYCNGIGAAMVLDDFDEKTANELYNLAKKVFNAQLSQQLLLNSVPLDLTSHIKQLKS